MFKAIGYLGTDLGVPRQAPSLHSNASPGSLFRVWGRSKRIGYPGTIYDWLDAIGDGTNGVPELISGLVVAGCLWIPILAYLFRIGLSASAHVINA